MEKKIVKYYYVNSKKQSVGPFSYHEFLSLQLDSSTLIWFTGQKEWRPLKEFDFLLPASGASENKIKKPSARSSIHSPKITKKIIYVSIACVLGVLLLIFFATTISSSTQKRHIAENAYDSEELYPYLETFYRDIEYFGINKKKSRSVCIKMAPMQYFEDTKDYYGVSYGYNDDDVIEIYINEDGWRNLNRAQKYALMYHELSHDILNVDDLPDTPENYDKLMGPVMSRFDNLTMDQFIDMSHELFLEVANE